MGAIAAALTMPHGIDMPSADTLAARIKSARVASGLSQHLLGEAMGVRNQTIWRYEAGRAEPSGDLLVKMAQTLGVSAIWLMTGEGAHDQDDGAVPHYPAYAEWLETAEGQASTTTERTRLSAARWHGEPSLFTYHHLLMAIRSTS